jgi:hypothetical protein
MTLPRSSLLSAGAALLAGCAAAALLAAPASSGRSLSLRHAAVVRHDMETSSNWAGYAVTPATGGAVTSFTNVVGTWVQPAVSCTAGTPSYSAFWVGLGGFDETASSLEQTGTESNCTSSNTAAYDAWYEILPAPPVRLKLTVRPGDTISAAVTVTGKTVHFRLRNLTRRTVVNKKVRMSAPDLTSAEWIAEAPATCSNSNRCSVLPLANFGAVDFQQAAATGSRHSGLIPDPAWSATAISLDGSRSGTPGFFGNGGGAQASAVPSALSTTGSFSVAWQPPAAGTTP